MARVIAIPSNEAIKKNKNTEALVMNDKKYFPP